MSNKGWGGICADHLDRVYTPEMDQCPHCLSEARARIAELEGERDDARVFGYRKAIADVLADLKRERVLLKNEFHEFVDAVIYEDMKDCIEALREEANDGK